MSRKRGRKSKANALTFKSLNAVKSYARTLAMRPCVNYKLLIDEVGKPKDEGPDKWLVTKSRTEFENTRRPQRGKPRDTARPVCDRDGVPYRDRNGDYIYRQFAEQLQSRVYTPSVSSDGNKDFEALLILKIDYEMGIKNGNVDERLSAYLSNPEAIADAIDDDGRKKDVAKGRGRKSKKNSAALVEIYTDDESLDFLTDSAEEFDAEDVGFYHDQHRDKVLSKSVSFDSLLDGEAYVYQGGRRPRTTSRLPNADEQMKRMK